ncbi:MAG TPA: hypothetical protein VIJ75_05155 [Hanamia sp.]
MVSADLNKLAELLSREGFCNDVSALYSASNMCYNIPDEDSCSYNFGSLLFQPDAVGGKIPFNAEDILIKFSISIEINKINSTSVSDPLNDLLFDLEIFGLYYDEASDSIKNLYSSWHLDRHIRIDNDGDNKYSHPQYHFTFGGKKMQEENLDYGATLILPSPRIAYPPMDAALGIDFILQNYINRNKTKSLLTNPEYREIINKSQTRLWKPFFCSLYSFFNPENLNISADFSPRRLMPLYC